jgi:hypothetical protein
MKPIYFSQLFFYVLFSILISSCGDSNNASNNELEKEKLELEKKKLELEEAKLKEGQNNSSNKSEVQSEGDSKKTNSVKSEYTYLLGKWKGKLKDKNLSIVIENIDGKTVTGYNVAGSNRRALKGLIYPDDRDRGGECLDCIVYKLVLSEPGDDKWDGVFTVYFEKYEEVNIDGGGFTYSGTGKWKSNNGKLSGDIELSKN